MTHDERDHPEWDGEAIAAALGRELARLNEDVWTHEPFLEWLAADARVHAERRTRAGSGEARLLQAGRALRARVLARQCGVGLIAAPPPLIRPARQGVPREVLEEAMAFGAVARVNLAAAAGVGRELWDEPVDDWIALPPGAPRVRALALRIAGDSMTPMLQHGDTVLVEIGAALSRGRIVVARHPDDGYVCKRVARVGRREVLLSSLNPAHGSVVIPRDQRLIVGIVRLAWRA
jgi:hypothetical protein